MIGNVVCYSGIRRTACSVLTACGSMDTGSLIGGA